MQNLEKILLQGEMEKCCKILTYDYEQLIDKIKIGMTKLVLQNQFLATNTAKEIDILLENLDDSQVSLIKIICDCRELVVDIDKMEVLSEKMLIFIKKIIY